ncbi:methyltransferase [Microbacterium ulmi]|uniref:Methyltransferase n=1 Tax=Microbacterium ulmi TaxID=179095 RepID=A0A7Y2Q035_9MICO|nr:methyltransferase [Microbacterium ulmi]NII71179.1 hypothetical protein [Microbacterium ulmi]NNH02485.1 methyltransferase [Microbacterium ulmi]
MTETTSRRLWVAYGHAGALGTIEKTEDEGYAVRMAGADTSLGVYPSMEVAKNALYSRLKPGSDWPEFREH